MLNTTHVMMNLAKRRLIFYSEADFQFALAWHIHEMMPDCQVRLEFKPFPDERMYLDIWLPTEETAIELKYLTRAIDTECDGERFVLRDQAAQDISRYDFLKDIQRLERVVSEDRAKAGCAVLLTNDQGYWNPPSSINTIDASFRLYEGREITGELAWSDRAGSGTTKNREEPIFLKGRYKLSWRDYSSLQVRKNQLFRYLSVEVGS